MSSLSYRCFASCGLAAFVLAHAASSQAHFTLQSPPSMYEQDDLGDPQKVGPCGDDGSAVPTGAVTAFQSGQTMTITIDETIFHPGHYRVALVENIADLPQNPPVTPGDTPCGTTVIQDPPEFPILADGVLAHTQQFGGPQTIEVTLPPDMTCTDCTLQVIEFMSDHDAPCFYHHCAAVSLQTDPVPTTSSASSTSSGATSSGAGASSGDDVTKGALDNDGGCSVAGSGAPRPIGFVALVAIGVLLSRRRMSTWDRRRGRAR